MKHKTHRWLYQYRHYQGTELRRNRLTRRVSFFEIDRLFMVVRWVKMSRWTGRTAWAYAGEESE